MEEGCFVRQSRSLPKSQTLNPKSWKPLGSEHTCPWFMIAFVSFGISNKTHTHTHTLIRTHTHTRIHLWVVCALPPFTHTHCEFDYGVASISRLLKIICLFCRISSLLLGSFAKETYNFKEPTSRSHPIPITHTHTRIFWWVVCALLRITHAYCAFYYQLH